MNTPKNSHSPTEDERPRSLLEVLLGAKVEDTNLSSIALERALELRIEQERTKQQYYKLENANRSIELFRMAKDYGVASCEIPKLFGGDELNVGNSGPANGNSHTVLPPSIVTESSVKQPLSYRFPPAGSNLRPKPASGELASLPARRTHSPARIGAHAVAALNEAASLKEEDQPLPLPPMSTHTNNSIGSHTRNLSLPVAKSMSPNIPSGMTSILSFGKDYSEPSGVGGASDSNGPVLRKAPMVHKKHRRARSVSSFGVIDLKTAEIPKQSMLPKLKIDPLPNEDPSDKRYDGDEITCSESSSRNESPTQAKNTNSVAKLLNNG